MSKRTKSTSNKNSKSKVSAPASPAQTLTTEPAAPMINTLPLSSPFSPFPGFPENQGSIYSEQISQVTTIFKNLRWYLVSNFRQPLSEAYVELGLVQSIVDLPIDDALRGGIEIKSKQLDEEEIEKLQVSLDRDDDINTVGQAAKWNRLFGGAGVLILTDQDPETPLDVNAITKDSEFSLRACDLWELTWTLQNADAYDPAQQMEKPEFFDYYGEKVHHSRVLQMRGLIAPSFIRPRLRGWGFSVVEILVRSINQYLKATDLSFEVLDEFKVDVYKMKNLINTLMSPQGKEAVANRIRQANYHKNYQNAIVMDSEDDFDHKNLSFAGLAEVMAGIRMQVASDMRMPMTKLFGISAAGFNSGEDDLEVYNSMVESQVRNKVKYDLLRVVELKCQREFGFIPDDLSISFKPLRVLSAEQEENVKTQKFNRILSAKTSGLISQEQFIDACNRNELLDITLEKDMLVEEDPAGEEAEPVEDGGKDSNDDQAPKDAPKPKNTEPKQAKDSKPAKESKDPKKNTIRPYTKSQRIERLLVFNSIDYDKQAYLTDGGDEQFAEGRQYFFDKLHDVDQDLWQRAKEASLKAFGTYNWKFAVWWFKKEGGKFYE